MKTNNFGIKFFGKNVLYSNFKYGFIKIILIFCINIFVFFYFKFKNNIKKMKVCLCTVGKNENRYIKEFVEHYKKYGIDKIFIYDNNDINGERFNEILNAYLEASYIKILNFRGKEGNQLKMFQDCYDKNYKKYDWMIFYDIDEFINLKDHLNIKYFLIIK